MSHEIRKHDNVVLHKQKAWWSKILPDKGVIVQEAPSPMEALRLAGLDWEVEQRKLYMPDGDDKVLVPGHVVNVRRDTGESFGVVGEGYTIAQNRAVAAILEEVGVKIETAGSLRNGRDIWFLALVDTFGVGIGGGDTVYAYAHFGNNHTGERVFDAYNTNVREVCANTVSFARYEARHRTVRMKHTSGLTVRLRDVAESLVKIKQDAAAFREQATALVDRPLKGAELQQLYADIYTKGIAKIPAKVETEADEKAREKAVAIISRWVRNFESDERQQVAGIQGTTWAAFNAVTQWADHERTVRRTRVGAGQEAQLTEREARWRSNTTGTSAEFKAVALKQSLALVS